MSNIVILVGSPRKRGNTDMLARAFAEGAQEKHNVKMLRVADMDIAPCIGCNTCFSREDMSCFRKDDMDKVYKALSEADVLVIASPVYFYGISSQIKAAIDRLHTPLRNTFHIKRACLLLCGSKPPGTFRFHHPAVRFGTELFQYPRCRKSPCTQS